MVLFLFLTEGRQKYTTRCGLQALSNNNKSNMKKHTHLTVLVALGVVLASCASVQPVSQVRDDIYFMPSEAPMTASVAPPSPEPHELSPAEDYFDEGTSQELGTSRSYYDMAYNDPHYYNYGRFGFGSGMGMGMGGMGMGGMGMGGMGMGFMSGWNGPGWGMSMGYGWGSGMGMGNMGWGSPYGWYDPWDPWNRWDPWNPFNRWNNWNRWNRPWGFGTTQYGGYGMGNYWGPYGNCMTCYAPVVIGGSSNTYIGHRSSLGTGGSSGNGGDGGTYQPRLPMRDPVSLDPVRREAARPRTAAPREQQYQGRDQDRSYPGTTTPRNNGRFENAPRSTPQLDRGTQQQRTTPRLNRGTEQRTAPSRTSPQRSSPERTAPSRGGSFDRGSSPSIGPSRSGGGGGGRPSGTPRPR